MKFLPLLSFLLFTSCAADSRFTYEEINGIQHLEITPDNLIQLFELSVEEQGDVLAGLGYEPTDGLYDYIMKTDSTGSDWQMVATRGIKANVFSIVWVSVKDNNRLAEFRSLANEKPHAYSKEQDVYILKGGGKRYFAKINDLIIGKEVSITPFPR